MMKKLFFAVFAVSFFVSAAGIRFAQAGGTAFAEREPVRIDLERESGDEFFYLLRCDKVIGCEVLPGDRIVFLGKGIVKGFVAPFRDAAKKAFGAWKVSNESSPGSVIFEATHKARFRQGLAGFVLVSRMGAPKNRDGSMGQVLYTYRGKVIASQGKIPGPAAPAAPVNKDVPPQK